MTGEANPAVEPGDLALVAGTLDGWKLARLWAAPDGQAGLTGICADVPYGRTDVAQCRRTPGHVPPEAGCRCGFYVWRHRASAVRRLWANWPALVRIELFGRFDEYALGFIGAAQAVRRVDLLGVCSPCLDAGAATPATGLAVTRPRQAALEPACATHTATAEVSATLDDLRERLAVPVDWLAPEGVVGAIVDFGLALNATPRRWAYGRVLALPVGGIGSVWPQAVSVDADGRLWLRRAASLVQPVAGADVPVRRRADGGFDALLEGVVRERAWPARHRDDDVALHPIGEPVSPAV